MNTFALQLWSDEGARCTFYSVAQSESDDDSDVDKFFDKFIVPEGKYETEAYELLALITKAIGEKFGAIDAFFDRHENLAQALPPKPKQNIEEIRLLGSNFPLRLYCCRISDKIVVLFNGGVKSKATAQESPDLNAKFRDAQSYSRRIMEALQSGMIEITEDQFYLETFDHNNAIIL